MSKGKILFVSTWYPSNIDMWLSTAFEDYGYEVIRVGKTYFSHYGIQWEPELLPKVIEELNVNSQLNLPELVNRYSPDILIFWDWNSCPIHNIEETKKLKYNIPVILVEHEGWSQNFIRKDLINPTLAYTGMPYGVTGHPFDSSELGYKYLPGACYPIYHRFLKKEFEQRDLDCVLFAGMYNPRPDICFSLRLMGTKIEYGQVNITNYEKFYNRSLTTWEFSGGQEFIKWRFFEAMSMGCIIITDRLKLMNMLGFEPNVHYLEYNPIPLGDGRTGPRAIGLKNIIDKVRNDPNIWKRISKDAHRFVNEHHTYEHRVKMIIKDLEEIKQ